MPDVREYRSVVEGAERAAQAGDLGLADQLLREALRLQQAALGANHPDLASTLNNLAVVCESLGNVRDAEQYFRRAYAIASGALPPRDPRVTTSFDNLTAFCAARGLPLEEWPGIGQTDVPVAPAPPSPPTMAASASFVRSLPTRAVAAAAALAAVGMLAMMWPNETLPGNTPAPAPFPAAPPAVAERAAAQAAATPTTAAPTTAARTREPSAAAPAAVRVVVAEVCASLSTSAVWQCDLLGTVAAPGRASYYTRIASARPTSVRHLWFQGGALRQNVTLSIGASPTAGYRTFSRQTLTAGSWRLELRDADGLLLHDAAFEVR